eukprot:TRINITY_DN3842_c0_g1_i3.p1 TRINITY_DN3842_c0_g1~~TRINITY_DN3842_c0_g1_i3.p1  ORF type:complete len:297 (-),score=39.28 TRINITY_DN3842_c0_g1_i3:61-951(-)
MYNRVVPAHNIRDIVDDEVMSYEEELLCDVTRLTVESVHMRSFEEFPLEIIALIADFVCAFDDLTRMSLVSHRARHGVLLSRQWIIVRGVVEATEGDVEAQRRILHKRTLCAEFACKKGLLRTLRVLNLSHTEVLDSRAGMWISMNGQLDVLKYLCTTYALTADKVMTIGWPCCLCSVLYALKHRELLKYMHSHGVTIPTHVLNEVCLRGWLETLKWLHTDIGFTAEDVRRLNMVPLYGAAKERQYDCVVYLRTGYGLTQGDAHRAIRGLGNVLALGGRRYECARVIAEVFEFEFN